MAFHLMHFGDDSKLKAAPVYVATSKSVLPDHRSAAERHRTVLGMAFIVAIFLLAGCTRTVVTRLDMAFDADPLGPFQNFPLPTPPNDQLVATARQLTTSVVVADPAGGKWLRITPSPQFLVDPDQRRLTTIAVSERFTTSPPAQIRGKLRLRLDGPGTVIVGFKVSQGGRFTDIIGGFQLYMDSFIPRGQVYVISGVRNEHIENLWIPATVAKITDYRPGSVIDLNWSIDQPSRTFYGGAGGSSESTTFWALSPNGVATTPIQALSLWVWLDSPSSNTVLYLDQLKAEEYTRR